MNFRDPVVLGRSGLKVGRLGISSSYGAPAEAFEEAFEQGCNYFTYGTFVKGGSPEMRKAIKNITAKGCRDQLVVSVYTYAHWPWLTSRLFPRDLKHLGIDYADVLILGYYSSIPDPKTLEMANRLKEQGLVKALGLSGHNRKLFPVLAEKKLVDLFHIRYNALHRGAEKEVFPLIKGEDQPGVVSFTATSWNQLLKPGSKTNGRKPRTASECYRFVLSHPSVQVCMVGTKNIQEMREDLRVLDAKPVTPEEFAEIH